jgi:hypothetical protein
MRKSILPSSGDSPNNQSSGGPWLDLEDVARAELSSEDPEHPFEHALQAGAGAGWRAAAPGPQVIRLHFDQPQRIRRIRLQFREDQVERSQEFAIFAHTTGQPRKDVVRQQWTFSPGHSSLEQEDYSVDLQAVSTLELAIDPGRHDKQVFATLQSISIAA